ncbi:MAG: hypothetical protein H7332_06940 [Bdellovibrionales bacterium]|nr:hypothetical protein [Ramlibacter sp.]
MYLVVIAWMYVVVMMSVAEATSTNGTIVGAIVTFLLYGLGPIALVVYLMGSPFRRKAIKVREAAEFASAQPAAATLDATPAPSVQPDAGSETPADAIAPVRKEL